ncbi:MAG TPA: hypothetical protein VGH87_18550 [Polyangiaceae bacterium]
MLGEITHPRDLTTSQPFYVAMQREAMAQLTKTHVASDVVAERDLSPSGVPGKAYALRYRVVEDHVLVTNTGSGCTMAITLTGSLVLLPIFFEGLCTRTVEHRLNVEARVFDLEGASISKVRDDNSNELLNVFDTSTMSPVLRKEYSVKVSLTSSVWNVPTGDDLINLEKEEAGEAVRQVLAQSLDEVGRSLKPVTRRVASR